MFTPKAGDRATSGTYLFLTIPEQIAETRESWSAIDVITSLVVVAVCVAFYIYFW